MQWFGHLSIRSKLGLLIALAAGSALILAGAIFVWNDIVITRRTTVQHLSAVADMLGANSVAALTFDQPEPAREILGSLRHEPIVELACVYDRDGRRFASYARANLPQGLMAAEAVPPAGATFSDDGRLLIVTEIRDEDGRVGWVFLQAGMEHLREQVIQHILVGAVVLVVSLCVSYVVSLVLQKRIAGPITELVDTVRQITRDRDYSVRVEQTSRDELGDLYGSFNRMLEEIQARETQLRCAHEGLETRVAERTHQLTAANEELAREITERERAQQELHELQEEHIEAARRAGMAEIATSVLHNVGNVLNSVNISASMISEKLRKLGISDLSRATGLMQQHADDLGAFVTLDQRGKHLPSFLAALGERMTATEQQVFVELESLTKNIEHIKDIVTLQQSYAGVSGFVEEISLEDLLEDAIRINLASIRRHGMEIVREYEDLPTIPIDKQKFLQVIVNLISNAKYSVMHHGASGGRISVRLYKYQEDRLRVEVADNGEGIPPENLTRIFSHGFTTKKDGHGFGLHGSALYAKEMDGGLTVSSEGAGHGAVFTLELPLRTSNRSKNGRAIKAKVP